MTTRKYSLSFAAALLLPASGVLAEPGITADKIIIGQAAGFTGPIAGTVKELTAGAKAYLDHVNANGGIHGRKIVLESMDDGFDPKRTPEVFKELIEKKNVFAMFLSRGTPTTEAGYPVLEAAKVPFVAPSTGAMAMYNPPRRYLFPVRASYHSETFKIVPQLINMGINRIAIFHTDDSFGQDGLAGARQAMKDNNLTALTVASHPRGTIKVEEAVAAIAKTVPQAVIMIATADASVAFVKQMKKTGLSPVSSRCRTTARTLSSSKPGEDGWARRREPVSPIRSPARWNHWNPTHRAAVSRLVRLHGRLHRRQGAGGGAEARRSQADAREADRRPRVHEPLRPRRYRRDLRARAQGRHELHRHHHHQQKRQVRPLVAEADLSNVVGWVLQLR
jgi:ABC-type branched-subunit amino acid transport system substrate-binding protein